MTATVDDPPGAGLRARIVVVRGGFRLDLALAVAPGEVVAILGPNGAGKTTALRALAGLVALHGGRIELDGRVLDEPRGRVFVAAQRRSVGVVFQDYLLFPHLSAAENVAFGPRSRGMPKAAAHEVALGWLARVGLAEYADHKPRQLSGGQAQRVALARALAVEPALLLLDEPLAALDARTRSQTRGQLHRHLAEHPGASVLVTHDPLDALVLADRLIIVEEGEVVQEGDAATITARPRTDYVARLVGLNLYRGQGSGTAVTVGDGFLLTVAQPVTGDVFVAFPPSAVALYPGPTDGSPRNGWPAVVAGVQRHGDSLRIQLDGPIATAADVTPAAAVALSLVPGAEVWASVKATEVVSYPA
jgi:molybdate transport system ATP-binding protein